MMVEGEPKNFGCKRCWPSNAEAAWKARDALTFVQELIGESHFIVSIRACTSCNQRFVSVFTEVIDWEGGNDPQYWTLMPITETEAADLIQQRDSLTESILEALGRDRRSILHGHPRTAAPWTGWGVGIVVGWHD